MVESFPLKALSPLDGRYRGTVAPLAEIFGEGGLIRRRIRIELAWLSILQERLPALRDSTVALAKSDIEAIQSDEVVTQVKKLEATLQHDVKSVELAIAEQLRTLGREDLVPWVHFACTSEDINNLALGVSLLEARDAILIPAIVALVQQLCELAERLADEPMLARTHGQPASPTTMGKELALFAVRLGKQLHALADWQPSGKCNGATGNYNAHTMAFRDLDWPLCSRTLVEGLGLDFNPFTTQIESGDRTAELGHILVRVNSIVLDMARDLWGYIALDLLKMRAVKTEVGSSTMPHKVNPIHFENAEGNLGVANTMLLHLASTLPVSRWQRDLSGSTLGRNIGSALGYCLQAYSSLSTGLDRIDVNTEVMNQDLQDRWEVLSEAVQTTLRGQGVQDAYERSKNLARGQQVSKDTIAQLVSSAADSLDAETAERLRNMTPRDYTGLAADLAREAVLAARQDVRHALYNKSAKS